MLLRYQSLLLGLLAHQAIPTILVNQLMLTYVMSRSSSSSRRGLIWWYYIRVTDGLYTPMLNLSILCAYYFALSADLRSLL